MTIGTSIVLLIIVVIILIVVLACKIFEAGVKIAAAIICLFLIATIAFGNGRGYVEKFSSFFKNGDKMVEYYDDYRERVDSEGVLDHKNFDEILENAKELNFRNTDE